MAAAETAAPLYCKQGDETIARANTGRTYKDAGVDIDAGQALVESIKRLARGTERPGTVGGIGGFGALFDLKAAGFRDPVLVSASDGVGTKLRVAQALGRHDTVGIDLVAMCVNDLVVAGAEPLFFLDYFACGRLEVGVAGSVLARVEADRVVEVPIEVLGCDGDAVEFVRDLSMRQRVEAQGPGRSGHGYRDRAG